MKRSTELYKALDVVKAEMKNLRDQGKVNEAHAKIDEIKNLEIDITEAEAEERDEIENYTGEPINGSAKYKKIENMGDIKMKSTELFQDAILPSESFAKVAKADHTDVSLTGIVNAVVNGKYDQHTSNYLNATSQSGSGKVLVPQRLSAEVIDIMRAKSAILANTPVIPLTNGNMTIAKVTDVPKAKFVAEGSPLPLGDMGFEPIKLYSRVIGVIVPVTEKLLREGQNVETAIRNALASAVAEEADRALLYGTGDGTEEAIEPKGILTYEGINKSDLSAEPTYKDLVAGIKPIAKANLQATTIVLPTDELLDVQSATNAQGDFLTVPRALESITIDGSNNVATGEGVAFDAGCVLVGINPQIQIEKGRVGNDFQNMIECVRVIMGVDVAVLREQGVTHMIKIYNEQ